MDKNELIASYFSKTLSKADKKVFDHLMDTDSEFADNVLFHKNLKKSIQKEEQEATKKILQDFEQEKSSSFNYKKIVAASIIVLIGLSCFWYLNTEKTNPDKLFTDNFTPYRNVVQPIVRGETDNDLKTKAFVAYESKKYNEAISYFNEVLASEPSNTILFYKANALLQVNKTNDAILIFQDNLKTQDAFQDKNLWYLSLAYLKNNNIEASKQTLSKLLSNHEFKKEEAKLLFKKLD
ncbi:tetratricopeptide repeat protein [Jejuia spongiicola]|uniref:Tetratricopeptide repeat protein n=1 Tax=Jejuia spongiicola TaxID=2942207 RepID=A0ABT0QGW2_9FLAO|nr:hypothetical protein [Jejuia spongiicola]MCL6296237.1 hypothetical protein [Jejuia spongiicola]